MSQPNTRALAKDIQTLIDLAKAQGVKSLQVGDIKVELYPQLPDGPTLSPAELAAALAGPKDDPDEVLYYSAGGAGKTAADGTELVPPLTGEEPRRAN